MSTENPLVVELGLMPERVTALLDGRDQAALLRRPAADAWSAKEVACHLRDAARIYHERLARTVSEERPLLAGYDEAALARESRYQESDSATILPALRDWRGRTVALLAPLPADAWQRIAVHAESGDMNLVQLAAHMVEHEREHLRDLQRLLGE